MLKLNLFVLLLVSTTVQAEIIFQPSGLKRGDRYRLVFVTSGVRDATSRDIEVYNDFVQSVADAAPIIGEWELEWKAVASTAEVDARDNVGYPFRDDDTDLEDLLPVYRIDGTEATHSELGLTPEFFSDTNAVLYTELNTILPQEATSPILGTIGGTVWTGTSSTGVVQAPLGSSRWASVGGSAGSGREAFQAGEDIVSEEHHFYAISEIITVVPEPSSSTLALLGMALLINRSRSK